MRKQFVAFCACTAAKAHTLHGVPPLVAADRDAVRSVPRRREPLAGGVSDGRRRVGRGAGAGQLRRAGHGGVVGAAAAGGRAERVGRVVNSLMAGDRCDGDDSFGGG